MSAENVRNRKAYFIGGGVGALSGAVFLIRDGKMSAENIHIYEKLNISGESMDGSGNADDGYVIRGGRMFDYEQYPALWNVLSEIPAISNKNISVYDEIKDFNEKVQTNGKARLVDRNGQITDVSSMGFDESDRISLVKLMVKSEHSLEDITIEDFFSPHFFTTNFWYMWATTFAFEPWHSAIEFKRYLHIFIHEFPRINNLSGVKRSLYNQYDSVILPMELWLKEQGVVFEYDCEVKDIEFNTIENNEKSVSKLYISRNGTDENVNINHDDIVIITNGSMTSATTLGSMTSPPVFSKSNLGTSWEFWERISVGKPEFGNPKVFDSDIDRSFWESFTVTCNKDNKFLDMMEKFSGNTPGTGALVTLKDSNWLMSIVIAYQPHFLNQPEGVTVFWGYGLFPNREGDYIKKKMTECTGEEILAELLHHLKFDDYIPEMISTSNCIPCILPFITSQFMPRKISDRPRVRPAGYKNLAFVGQFVEIPEGVVFTVEYSVRTAMTAVYDFLEIDKEIPAYFKGDKDIMVLFDSFVTMHK